MNTKKLWPTWKTDLKYVVLGLILGSLLGACSPTQFSRPSTSTADLNKDMLECELAARQAHSPTSVQRNLYIRCMNQRGYAVVKPAG